MEGIDYVTCRICKKQLQVLSSGHIQKIHKIAVKEYKQQFPKALLCCQTLRDRIRHTVEDLWKDGTYDGISNKVSQHWANGTYNDHGTKVTQAHLDGLYTHIYTEERSRKIGEAQKGVPKSEECKAKIAQAHVDGKYNDAPAKISKTVSERWDEGNYDHVDWSEVQLKSETVKLKSQSISKLHKQGRYDHIYSDPKVKQKQSDARTRAWLDGKYDGVFQSPSKLELRFAQALDKAGIIYRQQHRIGTYKTDFLIDNYLVVELNGDYWHGSLEAKEYDTHRNTWIEKQGYKVLVIWEHEFNNDPEACIQKVRQMKEATSM